MGFSADDVAKFKRDGFIAVHDMLTPLELLALQRRTEDIGNGVVEFPEEFIQLEPTVTSGEVKMDPDIPRFDYVRKLWNLTKFDVLFQEYARHPKIVEHVKGLLGDNVKIYLDQTLCKPALHGSPKPPHQDSAYWTNIDPPELVVCWMALDDATEDNGCMRFFPGSHKNGVVEHKQLEDFRVEDKDFDYENEVAVPLNAGSCTFHHSLSLHRTDVNTSPFRRRGLTVAYMSAESRFIGEGDQPKFRLVAGKEFEGCV